MKTLLLLVVLALVASDPLDAQETTSASLPGLPDPFINSEHTYHQAHLISVDSEGIRFTHLDGTTHIRADRLEPAIRHYLHIGEAPPLPVSGSTTATSAVLNGITQVVKPPVVRAAAPAVTEVDRIAQDPEYLSLSQKVYLTTRTQGGKSRYEPWKTDYGSYNRVDTSSYQLVCGLTSTSPGKQRVRMQAFRISRNQDTRELELTLLEDCKVTYGGLQPVTVSTTCEATNTDDKYAAINIREKSGDKYIGWTWRAIDGQGRICAISSSMPAYDSCAREAAVQ